MIKFAGYDVSVERNQGHLADDRVLKLIEHKSMKENSPTEPEKSDSDCTNDEVAANGSDNLSDEVVIDTNKAMVSFVSHNTDGETENLPSEAKESMPGSGKRLPQRPRRLPSTPEDDVVASSEEITDPSTIFPDNDEAKEKGQGNTIKYNSLPRSRKQGKSKSKFYTDVDIRFTGKNTVSGKKQSEDDSGGLDVRKTSSATNLELYSREKDISTNSPAPLRSIRLPESPRVDKNGFTFKRGLTLAKSPPQLKQTHIAIFSFVPRHKDELQFNEGDPLHVLKLYDDLWCEGSNLLTGKHGIFPCRYAADILSQPDILNEPKEGGDQYFLRFLGSVEVADYKGDEILCVAISKIVNQHKMLSTVNPQTCTLQISTKGIRITGLESKASSPKNSPKSGRAKKGKSSSSDNEPSLKGTHFFSMKNITYCGNHPRDRRYLAFITKHPADHRYACHVFMSQYSTDQVTAAVGNSFRKFYDDYLEYRAPTEDIYME